MISPVENPRGYPNLHDATITVRCGIGTTIDNAVSDALRLSYERGLPVTITFNGTEIAISWSDVVAGICRREYFQKRP